MVIRWRTDVPENSQVNYGLSEASLSSSVSDLNSTTEHEIEISSLVSNTKYFYSVGTTSLELAAGPEYYFVTAPISGTSKATRIWVIGDAGTKNINQQNVRDAFLTFTGSIAVDSWIMLGDNAYNTGDDTNYQDAVFDMYPSILKNSVVWPAFGNHEAPSANSSDQSGVFYDIFTLPDNGQAGGISSGTEAYYSFNYANIHFVCLNSHDIEGSEFDDMVSWLASDLASHLQNWTIAFWHHPPYSKGSHDSDNDLDSEGRLQRMREDVLPTIEAGGVDMVLSGHSHSYERSYLIDGHYGYSNTFNASMVVNGGNGQMNGDGAYIKETEGSASNEGTVYIVAGSSGQASGGSLDHPVMYTSLNALGSVILDFNGLQLDMTFIDDNPDDPEILDYLTMIKGEDLPLPVSLSLFRIREIHSSNAVLLEWKTETEVDNFKWLVQRKENKENYNTLTEINGQGNKSTATYYAYMDDKVKTEQNYSYRLIDVSYNGLETIHGSLNITISLPAKMEFSKNYPNPFNSQTKFNLKLPKKSHVQVDVYNTIGKKIKTLIHSVLDAGVHTLKWNGTNYFDADVVTGIYYVIATTNEQKAKIKIALIR